jgi:hypothetical protein
MDSATRIIELAAATTCVLISGIIIGFYGARKPVKLQVVHVIPKNPIELLTGEFVSEEEFEQMRREDEKQMEPPTFGEKDKQELESPIISSERTLSSSSSSSSHSSSSSSSSPFEAFKPLPHSESNDAPSD